jgi:Ni,Fe-hydrogenase III large subunit
MSAELLPLANGSSTARADVPLLDGGPFRRAVLDGVAAGARVSGFFGVPGHDGALELWVVLARDDAGTLALGRTRVGADGYAALTPECPELHLFERDVYERHGVRPHGHPWQKPVRFPQGDVGVTDFFAVAGEEVHEVAVGPVHAGVIEPGHFRFQCHGERVFHLEISLGYQHRGVLRALREGPEKRRIHYAETLAGDTSVGHATAYCELLEALGGAEAPPRAQALRGIALELERLANHTGDLGALAGDVGFLPTQSFCGRLRGDWLNLTAELCGSRFGRGLVRPGGVAFDAEPARAARMQERLDAALRDLSESAALLWDSASVMGRFEETGRLARSHAQALGLVGLAARACGIERDVRAQHPHGIWRRAPIEQATWPSGDVFARAWLRGQECERSAAWTRERLRALPEGPTRVACPQPAAARVAVALVEGWRGEICHAALTDADGGFEVYEVVDPSFHNWSGLALALRGQQISDFPLTNKSFNLSYCGFDL